MKDFSSYESKIRNLACNVNTFTFDRDDYDLILCGKPTVEGGGGETKTDIYIRAKCKKDGKIKEIKISYKKNNYSFVENKIKKERAEKIYGQNWSKIIQGQINSIKSKFEKEPLVYFKQSGNTCRGSVKMGWRYEMENDGNRTLGTKIDQDITANIWANKGASEKYTNGIIDGAKVPGSGIPNYFLEADIASIKSADDIFSNIVPIIEWLSKNTCITSAFLAQNYRTIEKKQEGNKRHLAVWVEWKITGGKLDASLIFNKPLEMESGTVFEQFKSCMKSLGIDLDNNFDIEQIREKLSSNVSYL